MSARGPLGHGLTRIAALYAPRQYPFRSSSSSGVAGGMAFGPRRDPTLDALADEPSLRQYHLLPSVRGDLLEKLGRKDEARVEFARAAALTRNERVRDLLMARAADT